MRRLPLLLCLPAALALTLRPARLTDAWGVGRVCADAFYPPGSKINGVDARYAWASTVLQRLVAMRRGALRPHALLVAVDADAGVVGCVELGLLPAPPGAPPASRLSTEASEAAALWRGVAVDNAVAWAPPEAGQQKRAKFQTSKPHISAIFHSFRLTFGRAIISRNGLEAWMLFPERARAEHSR